MVFPAKRDAPCEQLFGKRVSPEVVKPAFFSEGSPEIQPSETFLAVFASLGELW
jgi:hypothetical protein